jgi:hypothetical protein
LGLCHNQYHLQYSGHPVFAGFICCAYSYFADTFQNGGTGYISAGTGIYTGFNYAKSELLYQRAYKGIWRTSGTWIYLCDIGFTLFPKKSLQVPCYVLYSGSSFRGSERFTERDLLQGFNPSFIVF